MAERKYYDIDEATARRAHNMMSFRDYVEGSLTHEYRSYVDRTYDIADEVAQKRPDLAEKAYGMADRYSKRMADNLNKHSRIGCMCPSVMISGGSNFPVHKKEKQNAADERNRAEFMEIEKIPGQIRWLLSMRTPINAGDDDAVERLQKKVETLASLQERMVNVNAWYRKNKTLDGCPYLLPAQIEELKAEMRRGWHYEDKPYQSFELSNNRQNLKAAQERLERLQKAKERGTQEEVNSHFRVVENAEDMRLQVFFEDKPSAEVRVVMKGEGFRWAPSVGAWQRQLTDSARYALKRVVEALDKMEKEGEI